MNQTQLLRKYLSFPFKETLGTCTKRVNIKGIKLTQNDITNLIVYVSNKDETAHRIKLDVICQQFMWDTLMSISNRDQNREIHQCMYESIAAYSQYVSKQQGTTTLA